MREILFRGKRLDNGEWVEGYYCKHDTVMTCFSTDNPKTQHLIVSDGFCDWGFEPPLQGIAVDPATVGQYTGLQDKNGRRIFEGDIVCIERAEWAFDGMTAEYRTEQGIIAYDDWGMVGLITHKWDGLPVWSDFFHVCGLTDRVHNWSFEVIGNIHDTPEPKGGAE